MEVADLANVLMNGTIAVLVAYTARQLRVIRKELQAERDLQRQARGRAGDVGGS